MKALTRTGRGVGLLLLLQFASGLTVPFILVQPALPDAPDFLTVAAAHALQIRAAVLIAFVGGALTVVLGITALPILLRYSSAAAYGFLVVCAVSCTLDAVHNAAMMSMLSLSRTYVSESASDPATYQAVAVVVASTRRWAHYAQLAAVGGWICVFYGSLFRFALIPRLLAALGLVGIALQFTGVTLPMFAGYGAITWLAIPLAPIHLAVAIWLMVKGFDKRLLPIRPEAHDHRLAGA